MNIRVLGTIPKWWIATYAADIARAYDVFRAFLADLGLSLTDLARDIGVDQSTVSRWAVGRSHPTPDQMKRLLVALQSRIKSIAAATERVTRVAEGLHGVVQAFEASLKQSDAGDAPTQGFRGAAQRLHEALKESGQQVLKGRVRQTAKRRVARRGDV